jgi:D-beta-D-heptose 7-phosphate kinase/D-beta-D-heptose 1-phosphate adenosyltransferase
LGKVYSLSALKTEIKFWRETGKSIVFTNGCFDLLHRGHVEYLWKAKSMGDILIIGLNSDASVRRLKGAGRPLTSEEDRLYMLSHLDMVDAVCLFSEDTPLSIISEVQPDVLVKGGDYSIHEIVGREIVERRGGKVITVPVVKGKSTSNLIDQIQKLSRNKA